jgi:hypothetical protein
MTPPSATSRSSACLVKSGTSDAESTPPSKSSYTAFGELFALLYASARAVWPITMPNTATRARPDTRDNAVPTATTRLLRSKLLMPHSCPGSAHRNTTRPTTPPSAHPRPGIREL